MATVGQNNGSMTLAQVAKMLDPTGGLLTIANILERSTPIIKDMPMIEGNLPTGHVSAIRTGLPTPTWRILYGGILPSVGTVKQLTDTVAELTGLSQTDMAILKIQNNKAMYLLKDAESHLVAMGLEAEDNFIYGDSIDQARFVGLAPRYNALSSDKNNSGYNIIDGGGTGSDNTSIWVVCYGDGLIHGIYPKGSQAGIKQTTFPPRMISAPIGTGDYHGIETLFTWNLGLVVADWRGAVRIANIDHSLLADAGTSSYTGAAIINLLIDAFHRIPSEVKARSTNKVIYANEAVIAALDKIANNKSTLGLLSGQDTAGEPFLRFRGLDIKLAEKILNNEARIV